MFTNNACSSLMNLNRLSLLNFSCNSEMVLDFSVTSNAKSFSNVGDEVWEILFFNLFSNANSRLIDAANSVVTNSNSFNKSLLQFMILISSLVKVNGFLGIAVSNEPNVPLDETLLVKVGGFVACVNEEFLDDIVPIEISPSSIELPLLLDLENLLNKFLVPFKLKDDLLLTA